jgi:hypothetical protein
MEEISEVRCDEKNLVRLRELGAGWGGNVFALKQADREDDW